MTFRVRVVADKEACCCTSTRMSKTAQGSKPRNGLRCLRVAAPHDAPTIAARFRPGRGDQQRYRRQVVGVIADWMTGDLFWSLRVLTPLGRR